jgi:hypothetical protein
VVIVPFPPAPDAWLKINYNEHFSNRQRQPQSVPAVVQGGLTYTENKPFGRLCKMLNRSLSRDQSCRLPYLF